MSKSSEYVKLRTICEIEKKQDKWSGLPYVGLENILPSRNKFVGLIEPKGVKSNTFYFNENHVLYGRLRPYLKKVLTPSFEGHCSTEIFPIKVSDSVVRSYLAYWFILDSITDEINNTCTGARMPRANMDKVLDFYIFLPNLSEQKRIVKVLDKSFEAIDKAKENAQKNLDNCEELFEIKVENIFKKLRCSVESLRLGDVCKFVRGPFGGSLKKSCFKTAGLAVYEQQHAIYDQFDDIRYFIDENKFLEMKRFELLPGDLIMSCSGTMGRIAIVPDDVKQGIINQALLKLTPNENILVDYLKYWMESKDFQKQILENSVGAAIKNVASVKILKEIKIPLPSLKNQRKIVDELSSLNNESLCINKIYKEKIQLSDELKKAILQKAFSGELS